MAYRTIQVPALVGASHFFALRSGLDVDCLGKVHAVLLGQCGRVLLRVSQCCPAFSSTLQKYFDPVLWRSFVPVKPGTFNLTLGLGS
jgi:hypothetical protein